jgi:hypothetical protein
VINRLHADIAIDSIPHGSTFHAVPPGALWLKAEAEAARTAVQVERRQRSEDDLNSGWSAASSAAWRQSPRSRNAVKRTSTATRDPPFWSGCDRGFPVFAGEYNWSFCFGFSCGDSFSHAAGTEAASGLSADLRCQFEDEDSQCAGLAGVVVEHGDHGARPDGARSAASGTPVMTSAAVSIRCGRRSRSGGSCG